MIKLSEIFVPLINKNIYSAEELAALDLQPDFIRIMAADFNLIYVEKAADESNLCFAENREVRPEYRTTFSKADIVEIIFSQLTVEAVNMEQDVVRFSSGIFL